MVVQNLHFIIKAQVVLSVGIFVIVRETCNLLFIGLLFFCFKLYLDISVSFLVSFISD